MYEVVEALAGWSHTAQPSGSAFRYADRCTASRAVQFAAIACAAVVAREGTRAESARVATVNLFEVDPQTVGNARLDFGKDASRFQKDAKS